VFEDDDGSLYLFYAGRGEDAIGVASLLPVANAHLFSSILLSPILILIKEKQLDL
jgi:hypothetical protein